MGGKWHSYSLNGNENTNPIRGENDQEGFDYCTYRQGFLCVFSFLCVCVWGGSRADAVEGERNGDIVGMPWLLEMILVLFM